MPGSQFSNNILKRRLEIGLRFPSQHRNQILLFGGIGGYLLYYLIETKWIYLKIYDKILLPFFIILVPFIIYLSTIEGRIRKIRKYKTESCVSDTLLEPLDMEILKFHKEQAENYFVQCPLREYERRKEILCKNGFLSYDASENTFFITNEGLKILESPSTYFLSIPSGIKIQFQKAIDHLLRGNYDEAVRTLSKNVVEKILKEKMKIKIKNDPMRGGKKKKMLGDLIKIARDEGWYDQQVIQTLWSFNSVRIRAVHDTDGADQIDFESAQKAVDDVEIFLKKCY